MLDQLFYLAQSSAPTLGDGTASVSDWKSGAFNLVLFVLALGIPFLVGRTLAKALRMPTHTGGFTAISFVMLLTALVLVMPTFVSNAPKLLFGPDIVGGTNLIYEVDRSAEDKTSPTKVTAQDFRFPLMNRLNPSGTLEINIRANGDDKIEITIPAVDDSQIAEIERLITEAGILQFRIVANMNDHKDVIDRAIAQADSDDQNVRLSREVKLVNKTTGEEEVAGLWRRLGAQKDDAGVRQFDGYQYGDIVRNSLTGRVVNPPPSQRPGDLSAWLESQKIDSIDVLLALQRAGKPYQIVDGVDLERATKTFGQRGGYEVAFTMSTGGASKMLKLTGANLPDASRDFKRRMAILLDGNVLSAPNLNDTISANGVIQGNFSETDVQRLVDILNAGALPGVLSRQPVSKNVIGASMGQIAIAKGGYSSAIALATTILLVVAYYRFSGLIATLALLLNLAMILAVMILIRQPLTLAGLAGLVLSVGMSVDANVLVFERIREERDRKATPRLAIRNGFDRAWTTIFDSNLTTLITALVLYWVGTEQIKGFAVTLIIGLVISLFTAVYFTHKLFEICERTGFLWLGMADYVNSAKRAVFGIGDVDFMKQRYVAYAVSGTLIVIGLVATFLRGSQILDIDFNGGTSIVFSLDKGVDADDVRAVVNKTFDADTEGLPIQTTLINVAMEGVPKDSVYKLDVSLKDQKEVADRLLKGFSEGGPARLVTYDVDVNVANAQSSLGSLRTGKLVALQEPATGGTTTPAPEASNANNAPADNSAPKQDAAPESAVPPSTVPPAEAAPVAPAASADVPADAPAVRSKLSLQFHTSTSDGEAKINASQLREALIRAAQAINTTLVEPQIELLANGVENWTPESSVPVKDWTVYLPFDASTTQAIGDKLREQIRSQPVWQSISKIEGSVATEMQQRAWAGLFLSLVFIAAYIWFRFQKLAYGIAAVIGLIHDVLITLCFVAVSHWLFRPLGFLLIEDFKISLTIVAAFLTIIGYSLNDTIVVFDRIREVKGKSPRLTKAMINQSVTQTLSRTLLTSSTTIVAILLMYIFGGEGIHGFAYCLLVGIIVGTYSSIFVAAPILLYFVEREQNAKAKGPGKAAA
jgi:SecD/SecF fusion protein